MKILFRPIGGFCQRLRSLASAALWAEDLHASLEIFWPVEAGVLPSRIEHLIETDSIPCFTYSHIGYLSRAHHIFKMDDMITVLEMWKDADEIRIESSSEFHPDILGRTPRGMQMFRRIKINSDIVADTISVARRLGISTLEGEQWIGIHIRRGDHKKCIDDSPVELFVERIESYLRVLPQIRFFLATDDPVVKAYLERLYRNSLVVYDSQLGRRNVDQMRDGVLEWLLLRRCSSIIASKGSAYSEIAAFSGGIQLEVLPGPKPWLLSKVTPAGSVEVAV